MLMCAPSGPVSAGVVSAPATNEAPPGAPPTETGPVLSLAWMTTWMSPAADLTISVAAAFSSISEKEGAAGLLPEFNRG